MSSTAIALSALAIASSNSGNKKETCQFVLKQQPETKEEMLAYRDCVNYVHKEELVPAEILMIKILIVIGLIGAVYGFIKTPILGGGCSSASFSDRILDSIFMGAVSVTGLIVICALCSVIMFLFS